MPTDIYTPTDNIPAGQALGSGVQLSMMTLCGIIMPATWTAASLTFQACVDGASWEELYDNAGNEITITVAASRYIIIPPTLLLPMPYLKVRSGTAASPVNQVAAAAIQYVCKWFR
jgi:hypothetical protein